MALIQTGSIVADIRGKVGDEIYSRNRGGSYVKSYAVPTGEPSPRQLSYRENFAQAVSVWNGLPEASKQIWDSYAQANPQRLRSGLIKSLTGRALYIQRFMVTWVPFNLAPEYPQPPALWPGGKTSLTVASATSILVDFGLDWVGSEFCTFIYMTDQLPSTIRSFNSRKPLFIFPIFSFNGPDYELYTRWGNATGGSNLQNGNRLFCAFKTTHTYSGASQVIYRDIHLIDY